MSVTLRTRPQLSRSYDREYWSVTHHTAERSYELRIKNDGAGDPAFEFGFNELGDWHQLVMKSERDYRIESIVMNSCWETFCPNCTMLSDDARSEANFTYGDCPGCLALATVGATDFVDNDHLYGVMTEIERDIMVELRRYWDAVTLLVGVAL